MPNRKKHPRLPNGYGSIRYLGSGRKNSYGVYPPANRTDTHGNYLRPEAICYVDDWYVGFAVLNAWHAGSYKLGDEVLFRQYRRESTADLKYQDLQDVVDGCGLKLAAKENIASLLKQVYKYGNMQEICARNPAEHVTASGEEDEHGVPLSDEDLAALWGRKDDPTVEMILIMCYSGYRITAYKTLEVNLDGRYFRGGVKTKAGKNRVVPIHSAILQAVQARMGHSFGADITNGIYGHRTLDGLRAEIEKIKV